MRISVVVLALLVFSALAKATIYYHHFSWDDAGLCSDLSGAEWKPAQVEGTWLAEIHLFAGSKSPVPRVVLCVTHDSNELVMSRVAHGSRMHEEAAFVIGLNEDFVSRFETRAVKAMIAHEIAHVRLGDHGVCNRFKPRSKDYQSCEHDVDEEAIKLVPRCDMVLALERTYVYLLGKNMKPDELGELTERIDLLDPAQECK